MSKTAVVQIGNSDDKLTQKEWSKFILDVQEAINAIALQIHFSGSSDGSAEWQNHAWVFEVAHEDLIVLGFAMSELRKKYSQESIAVTTGETTLV